MGKCKIEFIDPNLPQVIEKALPSILAQAIICKLQQDLKRSAKTA